MEKKVKFCNHCGALIIGKFCYNCGCETVTAVRSITSELPVSQSKKVLPMPTASGAPEQRIYTLPEPEPAASACVKRRNEKKQRRRPYHRHRRRVHDIHLE